MRYSVICLVTQVIVIRRNSNGFKIPLPLPLILLPLLLKCKAAPKMQHSNCCQRKSRTLFSMAEVVKLDNLRKRYRFERAINTQWPIENPYYSQIYYGQIWCMTPLSFDRYPGIFSATVSILIGHWGCGKMHASCRRTQAAWIGE